MATGWIASHGKKWFKRIAFTLGALIVLLGAFVAFVIYELSQPKETKLGGDWILSEPQYLVIEAGTRPLFLQRKHGRKRITIMKQPASTVYIGNDCVLFAAPVPESDHKGPEYEYIVQAACGDRKMIPVAYSRYYVVEGDLGQDPARINGKEISWSEIRQHAENGEPFQQ